LAPDLVFIFGILREPFEAAQNAGSKGRLERFTQNAKNED